MSTISRGTIFSKKKAPAGTLHNIAQGGGAGYRVGYRGGKYMYIYPLLKGKGAYFLLGEDPLLPHWGEGCSCLATSRSSLPQFFKGLAHQIPHPPASLTNKLVHHLRTMQPPINRVYIL